MISNGLTAHHYERDELLARLAADVGTSQSVLRDRFVRVLGEPPLAYLSRWRLQLAARGLETTDANVMAIAIDVGYRSEAAFNRAFRREFGLPPAQYRRQHRAHSRRATVKRSAR